MIEIKYVLPEYLMTERVDMYRRDRVPVVRVEDAERAISALRENFSFISRSTHDQAAYTNGYLTALQEVLITLKAPS